MVPSFYVECHALMHNLGLLILCDEAVVSTHPVRQQEEDPVSLEFAVPAGIQGVGVSVPSLDRDFVIGEDFQALKLSGLLEPWVSGHV